MQKFRKNSFCSGDLLNLLKNAKEGDTVFLPRGQYFLTPESGTSFVCALSNSDGAPRLHAGILLEGRKNLTLDGQGSTLLCHGQMTAIALLGCQNITLQNFIIDWDIPLTAEGTVLRSDDSHVDLWVDPEKFPFHILEDNLWFDGGDWSQKLHFWGHTEFDPVKGRLAPNRGDRFPPTRQELLPGGEIRFTGDFAGKVPTPGNILVLRHGDRIHPAILIHNCRNVTLQNVRIHGSGGLGILAQFSDTLTFSHAELVPNHEKGRLFVGGHDDGIHLSANRGPILIENCRFCGLMDDPINLHGIAAKLLKQLNGYTVLGSFMHPQSKGHTLWARPGDTVAILNGDTMEEFQKLRVKHFRLLDETHFEIQFEECICRLHLQSCSSFSLENISSTAALICRHNDFGPCRARGLLVTTPKKVIIEDNIFSSSGAAIRIAGDVCTWYESGRCQDVTIRNNVFADTCLQNQYQGGQGIISISPELPKPCAVLPCHRHIRIRGNTFHVSDPRLLYALCTRDLQFTENRILRAADYSSPQRPSVTLELCQDCMVSGNQFIGF